MPGDAACDRGVGDAAPGHEERKQGADHGSEIDQEGLDNESFGFLRVVEHVGDQGPEGLHRDVEGEIHEQEDQGPHDERCEGQQHGTVGHEEQCDRRDDGTSEDVGDSAAQPGPGSVGEDADDGLDDQSGQRCGQPEIAQVAQVRAQRLQNARRIGVLERVSDLYAQESEAEIPDLPEFEFRFFHSGFRLRRVGMTKVV